jgi:undecaprenyl diphosphate synthase
LAKVLKDSKIKAESLKKIGNIPTHIAIIMDGNGRWAKQRGLPRAAGHKKGVETIREIVEACVEIGVKYLTLYTFSTENWKRPKSEVTTLWRLIVKSLHKETKELHSNNIKLTTIGNTNSLPEIVSKELFEAIKMTSNNNKMVLNLALSYSGRWEIIEAVKRIARLVKESELDVDSIDEKIISQNLTTAEMPDPDLVIRSGGEFRISNFLLWQIAYSEVYITNVLWPEFSKLHLIDAIKNFQNRERRFGLVSEQLSSKK